MARVPLLHQSGRQSLRAQMELGASSQVLRQPGALLELSDRRFEVPLRESDLPAQNLQLAGPAEIFPRFQPALGLGQKPGNSRLSLR